MRRREDDLCHEDNVIPIDPGSDAEKNTGVLGSHAKRGSLDDCKKSVQYDSRDERCFYVSTVPTVHTVRVTYCP